MALIFQDSFSKWGNDSTSRTNMSNSSNMWTTIGTGFGCTTTMPRAGTHSLRFSGTNFTGTAKFSLGGIYTSSTTFGVGAAIYLTTLPTTITPLLTFFSSTGQAQYSVIILNTGALRVILGAYSGPTVLGTSTAGDLSPSVFKHIEVKTLPPTSVNATDGTIDIRVDGMSVLSISGVDIMSATTYDFETGAWFPSGNDHTSGVCYIADAFVWNSTGSYCNDWIGNKVSYLYFPDADTGTADWSITGSGTSFGAIDEADPDGDTSYIAGTAVNQETIVEIPAIASTITGIKAATLHTVMNQDAAGSSQVQVSLVGTSSSDGVDRVAPYPTYTAYQDHFYQDPDGGGDLTPALLSAMKVKVKRTV